nr:hypothetical protein [Tanacetum cinerariifolium]
MASLVVEGLVEGAELLGIGAEELATEEVVVGEKMYQHADSTKQEMGKMTDILEGLDHLVKELKGGEARDNHPHEGEEKKLDYVRIRVFMLEGALPHGLNSKVMCVKCVMYYMLIKDAVDTAVEIRAYFYEIESDIVIMDGICEFSSLTGGSSEDAIEGLEEKTGCSLSLKVDWT